ncbi:MAG: cardiolipin synthase [Erysipelotrichaceae bacterium]
MKKFLHFFTNRLTIVVVLLVIQFLAIVGAVWMLSSYSNLYILFYLISLLVGVNVVRSTMNPTFKLSWMIVIFVVPIFGGLFYLIIKRMRQPKQVEEKMESNREKFFALYQEDHGLVDEMRGFNRILESQSRFIETVCGMSAYKNTDTTYYPLGEDFFEALKIQLRNAKRYIYMEYFILAEGEMWSELLDILKERVDAGVDVRLIYDDAGSINLIPDNYEKILASYGIQALAFNPFVPAFSIFIQNRDHRKITIIDGHTAFTGGINIADEYINTIKRYGHWKDCAMMMQGEAVYAMNLMFLENWHFHKEGSFDPQALKVDASRLANPEAKGYVQPYGDSPYDNETVGESIYMNMFNVASDYIYINTPYLIINNEVATALILAAKKGVDVRIVTPGVADKPFVHFTTRSYYEQLIEGGVHIYEYTPGFIHSKTCVVDGLYATIGTVNLDYRSLYYHFECGVFMYDTKALQELKADFESMLDVCTQITPAFYQKQKLRTTIAQAAMRIVAPLM